MAFDSVLLRAVLVASWATADDPGPLCGYEFTFWACSRRDPSFPDVAEVDCRGCFDEHLLGVSNVRSCHDGRHPSIQAAILSQTLRRDASLEARDRRPQPWQSFCDELVRIFSEGHQGYLGRRHIIWRCAQGRHRSLGMAVAAAAVLRYFGAAVRVFAGRGRLCGCNNCCSFHDVRVTADILQLMELIMGVQLAESTSRLQNEGIHLTDKVHAFLAELIEWSDPVWEHTLDDVLRP